MADNKNLPPIDWPSDNDLKDLRQFSPEEQLKLKQRLIAAVGATTERAQEAGIKPRFTTKQLGWIHQVFGLTEASLSDPDTITDTIELLNEQFRLIVERRAVAPSPPTSRQQLAHDFQNNQLSLRQQINALYHNSASQLIQAEVDAGKSPAQAAATVHQALPKEPFITITTQAFQANAAKPKDKQKPPQQVVESTLNQYSTANPKFAALLAAEPTKPLAELVETTSRQALGLPTAPTTTPSSPVVHLTTPAYNLHKTFSKHRRRLSPKEAADISKLSRSNQIIALRRRFGQKAAQNAVDASLGTALAPATTEAARQAQVEVSRLGAPAAIKALEDLTNTQPPSGAKETPQALQERHDIVTKKLGPAVQAAAAAPGAIGVVETIEQHLENTAELSKENIRPLAQAIATTSQIAQESIESLKYNQIKDDLQRHSAANEATINNIVKQASGKTFTKQQITSLKNNPKSLPQTLENLGIADKQTLNDVGRVAAPFIDALSAKTPQEAIENERVGLAAAFEQILPASANRAGVASQAAVAALTSPEEALSILAQNGAPPASGSLVSGLLQPTIHANPHHPTLAEAGRATLLSTQPSRVAAPMAAALSKAAKGDNKAKEVAKDFFKRNGFILPKDINGPAGVASVAELTGAGKSTEDIIRLLETSEQTRQRELKEAFAKNIQAQTGLPAQQASQRAEGLMRMGQALKDAAQETQSQTPTPTQTAQGITTTPLTTLLNESSSSLSQTTQKLGTYKSLEEELISTLKIDNPDRARREARRIADTLDAAIITNHTDKAMALVLLDELNLDQLDPQTLAVLSAYTQNNRDILEVLTKSNLGTKPVHDIPQWQNINAVLGTTQDFRKQFNLPEHSSSPFLAYHTALTIHNPNGFATTIPRHFKMAGHINYASYGLQVTHHLPQIYLEPARLAQLQQLAFQPPSLSNRLLSRGLDWASRWAAKKGLKGAIGKLAKKVLAKAAKLLAKTGIKVGIAAGLGAATGGVATAIMAAWEAAKKIPIVGKVLSYIEKLLLKALKWAAKIIAALIAALIMFVLWLIGMIINLLTILLPMLLGFIALGPPGALLGFGAGALMKTAGITPGSILSAGTSLLGQGIALAQSLLGAIASVTIPAIVIELAIIGTVATIGIDTFFNVISAISTHLDPPPLASASTSPTDFEGIACFEFDNREKPWTEFDRNTVQQVVERMFSCPAFHDRVCGSGGNETVNLVRGAANVGFGGFQPNSNTIILYDLAFSSPGWINTTMPHEATHIAQARGRAGHWSSQNFVRWVGGTCLNSIYTYGIDAEFKCINENQADTVMSIFGDPSHAPAHWKAFTINDFLGGCSP